MPPRKRVLRHATVVATERVSPSLVRLSFVSDYLVGLELPHTDHYVKIVFATGEGEVTRTYSLRRFDTEAGTMDIDFVVHGDDGLAGPWAAHARPGETIGYYGPGGAWHPSAEYDTFVLAGDEAAAPAICAAIEALPEGASAAVFLEVDSAESAFAVPEREGVSVHWVERGTSPYGVSLAARVRAHELPQARVSWFVHGVAEMIKDLRKYLFVELGVQKADASISGYWRTGMTEDAWQASKHEFVAAMEREEAGATA